MVQIKSPFSILIGACHKHYIRFWKIPEATLLCSCRYVTDDEPKHQTYEAQNAAVHADAHPVGGNHRHQKTVGKDGKDEKEVDKDILSVMTINPEHEDLLIGGYDNGESLNFQIRLQYHIIYNYFPL